MRKYILVLVVILTIFSLKTNSQSSTTINFLDKWSITASSGVTMEWGDTEANWFGYLKAKPAFALVLTKEVSPTFEIRTQALYATLRGYQPDRNRDFIANIFEWNITGTVDFTKLSFGIDPCRKFMVHGIIGIGFFNFSSILRTINTDSIIATVGYDNNGNKNNYKTEPVFNTGFNIKYKISRQIDIVFENTWTVTGTDYLDGHKGGFQYDIYSYTSIGISYNFNFRKFGKAFNDCGGGGATSN